MPDSASKRRWDKQNVVYIGIKLFSQVGEKENDQAIIDYLQDKVKGAAIKQALREYMSNHPEETKGE